MNLNNRPLPLGEKIFRYRSVSVRYSVREWRWALIMLSLVLLLGGYLLTIGSFPLTVTQICHTLLGWDSNPIRERILFDIRLPRVLTALFVGAALGVSGTIFQSVSRNALGSPDIIGFTAGAATGALLQIILFDQQVVWIVFSAVLGGLFTAMLVYLLARKGGMVGGYRLILIGIGIGSMLNALNHLMLVKGDLDDAISANLWLTGSLQARTWLHALPVIIGFSLCFPWVVSQSRALHLIEMGDDMATQIGVNLEKVRLSMIFLAVVLAALATGAAGPIAFIALAAPQLVSRLIKVSHLPVVCSALMGALLLLCADYVSQSHPFGLTLPIGQLTGLVGGGYLLWLLTRSDKL